LVYHLGLIKARLQLKDPEEGEGAEEEVAELLELKDKWHKYLLSHLMNLTVIHKGFIKENHVSTETGHIWIVREDISQSSNSTHLMSQLSRPRSQEYSPNTVAYDPLPRLVVYHQEGVEEECL